MPVGLRRPRYGSLFIDDAATGFVSATTPTAEVVDGDKVVVGEARGLVGDVTAGSLTVPSYLKPAIYSVSFDAGSVLGVNASVITIEVYKNGAVITTASTALGGAIKAVNKMQSTAAAIDMSAKGLVKLNPGDVLTLRVTGTVTTVTIKNLYFSAIEVA